MKKKRILVWAYFTKNTGDDLFLKTMFDRYPNVEWDLLTANRNYKNVFREYKNVNIIYSYRDITIGKWELNLFFILNDLFFNYKKYDALVNIGGSIFKQNKAWEFRFIEREYLLTKFKKLNKKVFIIGANFGPYEDEVFIEKYRRLFVHYDDICFRDSFSYNLFKDFDNVRVAPDIVLSLDINQAAKKEKSVGFSLIDIEKRNGLKEYYHDYNKKMIQLMETYLEQGYKIKLFSFCEYEGDIKISRYITNNDNLKHNENIESINYDGDIDHFLNEFKTCEVIIGTRFHSIILAFLFNQSVFPIIYSDKTYNVLTDLNISKHFSFIKDIEKLDVKEVFENTRYNKIDSKKVGLEAQKHFEKLDLFIEQRQYSYNQSENFFKKEK